MSRVVDYYLPNGYCWIGKLLIPAMPEVIRINIASDAAEKRVQEMERLRFEK